MFFAFLLVASLLANTVNASDTSKLGPTSACPYKSKSCENPHDLGLHCNALTAQNISKLPKAADQSTR